MGGYSKIADFMGQHPESALVLRFSDMNLQNILYLQAEIYGLREDLRKIQVQNQTSSSEDVVNFSLDWYTLAHTQDNDGMNRQWQIFKQLRRVLKEYNEAVLQFHQMSKMASPSPHDLHGLQEWLRRPTLGAIYLTGRDRDVWADGVDLISIGERPSTNQITSWIAHYLLKRINGDNYTRLQKKHGGDSPQFGSIAEYSDAGIIKAANLVGTVLASVLPVVAIVVLYSAKGMGTRLGLTGLFSAIFSTCLWFLNDGKLIEVFSATSA
ncbi:hypothetical protein MMC07_004578 [Pseudocyphellaria aurata]|nr:hypothetical protein [Pseudocyphellaria aurata]